MIKYDLTDWELVTDIDQLSDGELYFVALDGEMLGLMEFDGDELSNESDNIVLCDSIPDHLYVMEMNWPMPPKGIYEPDTFCKYADLTDIKRLPFDDDSQRLEGQIEDREKEN